jgi:tetratricopeptide (TPR) repeat protein
MSEDWRQIQRVFWEKRAGSLLHEMLFSRQGAERLLEHPEPSIRMVAIEVLNEHWKPDANLARASECMAFNDMDSDVREIALSVFAACFEYTDDPRVGHILANIVRDEQQPMKFRSMAYNGLFKLRGKSVIWYGLYDDPANIEFPFPKHVDWPFVDSFIDESRTPLPVDPLQAALPNCSEEEVNAVRLYEQGVEALENHEYQKCVEYLTDIFSFMPYAAGAAYVRGCAYIELGRVDEAIADLSLAVEANPNSLKSLRARSRAYRLKGVTDLAEQDERSATKLERE